MVTKQNPERTDRLRRIPSMETILTSPEVEPLLEIFGREKVKQEMRRILDEVRDQAFEVDSELNIERAARQVRDLLEGRERPDLRPVINGTGVLVHTNLGRSPISREHQRLAEPLLSGYSNLEIELDSGSRGSRQHHIERIAGELFGCEAALLVNNNAAGLLLALSAIAGRREVIVSRSELVEIGGSFRVPDIIRQGGAILREVGTTNRTRAADYEAAIVEQSAAILVVRQSNFKIVGFTESPALGDLVGIAHSNALPLILDEGSGRTVDLSSYGLPRRETLRELLEIGVDLVTCSTDKLIGSSQGGLLLGRKDLIDLCRRHPLMRAVRPGKESFALVTAALSAFARDQHEKEIPLYTMLATPLEALSKRAATIAERVGCQVVETDAVVGGGTTPTETISSIALAFGENAGELAERLRRHDPPVIGRIENDLLLIDLRTVLPEQDAMLQQALLTLTAD